jgi:hypothetical protein
MAAQQSLPARQLRIIPLEGQNAVNYMSIGVITAPVVEVRDENDRPIEGATVTFKFPDSGPSATVANNQTTQTTISDFRGQAGVTNYAANGVAGRFNIDITATHQGRTARFVMIQTNSLDALPPAPGETKKSGAWKWILLGIAAGAGAGVGIYLGTRSSNTPISISTGPVIVGGPR